MEFRILGPLEVLVDGERPAARRARAAEPAGSPAAARERGRLIGSPHRRAVAGRVPSRRGGAAGERLTSAEGARRGSRRRSRRARPATCSGSTPGQLDLHALRAAPRARPTARSPTTAAGTLREALALWRGARARGLRLRAFAQAAIGRLEELRLLALERRIARGPRARTRTASSSGARGARRRAPATRAAPRRS